MTRRHAAVLLVALLPAAAGALPAAPSDIVVERLPEAMRVNGLMMAVTRLTGPGLRTYIAAIEAEWRARGGEPLAWRTAGSWQTLARRTGSVSEVLQVRRGLQGEEALLSRLDVAQVPQPPPRLSLALPSACRALSVSQLGNASEPVLELSGRCAAAPASVLSQLRARANAAGWQEVGPTSSTVVQFQRDAQRLACVVTTGFAGSQLVMLETRAPGAP